jgi:ribosomal protein S18 acetylase RimI-like enzyme
MTSSPRLRIERATVADAAALAPLFDGYRQFYGKPSDIDRAHWFLTERLSRQESVVFGASVSQLHGFAGFVQLYPIFSSVSTGRVWHLNDLFVRVDARRLGIAKALMLHAIAFARQDGAVRLTLETAVDNAPARALYESLGMTLGSTFVKYALPMD